MLKCVPFKSFYFCPKIVIVITDKWFLHWYRLFRCTLTSIPQTQALLNKAKLPLGLLLHPFKDLVVCFTSESKCFVENYLGGKEFFIIVQEFVWAIFRNLTIGRFLYLYFSQKYYQMLSQRDKINILLKNSGGTE